MTHAFTRGLICLALCGFAGASISAESGHGEDKPADSDWVSQTTQTCASCHGKKGVAQTENFPTLAGQYQDYLLHSLKAYRDGERKNGIMAGQVQGMTDDQFKALARYYSKQESPLHTPSLD
ncbi:cytochrome c, class I [Salinisphaera dokdonensis CL-ES53]|uniref:Cytochrome c, class I n=1 Tax=Salinisphaera dokdonensis CL-ES53 TaxID=1304272 RepID=A0ABV2B0L9_9GAMM